MNLIQEILLQEYSSKVIIIVIYFYFTKILQILKHWKPSVFLLRNFKIIRETKLQK